MRENPLWEMRARGQGVWLRAGRRLLIDGGLLDEMIRTKAVSGLDGDLTMLAGAVSRGVEYADTLLKIAADDGGLEAAEALIAEEARIAAEALLPVYRESDGRDGLVSVDAGAAWVNDADSMSRAARRMASAAIAPNVVLKLPPTDSGFAVFEALVADGRSVHIGPFFSIDSVERATQAFLRGARGRTAHSPSGPLPTTIISFGLAPLDIAIDELLRDKVRGAGRRDMSAAESLLGSTATAAAKVACRRQREIVATQAAGESELGPLLLAWTDLSTGDARQPRRRYVESLIGPGTAVVVSYTLLGNLAGRGAIDATLGQRVDQAEEMLVELEELGIDARATGAALEAWTARRSAAQYEELSGTVAVATRALVADRERAAVVVSTGAPWSASRPEIGAELVRFEELAECDAVARVWNKDASLWSADEQTRELIDNRMGWLDAAADAESVGNEPLRRFAAQLEEADVEHVVLLGVGGSSLGAEVCQRVFASDRVRVLGSTIPAHIRAVTEAVDPARTSVLVASKSGTTTEVRALLDYFYTLATPMLESPGERFAAITDPGTPLEQVAHERDFQRLWLAPADVGGRFSALTVFGTLPMTIMGIETPEVLASARRMAANCAPEVSVVANPAARLAAALHQALIGGRDKLSFVLSSALTGFGPWAEQLLAESTGKQGRGVIPIVAEPPGVIDEYGDDRLFISMRLEEEDDLDHRGRVDALEAAGHPVVRIVLEDRHDIGAEFFRWEAAVALLGALMGINPFDQPDVQASKDRTEAILAAAENGAPLPERPPVAAGNGWMVFADLERDPELASRLQGAEMPAWLHAHLGRASAPDYLGIQAFVTPRRATHRALQRLRVLLRQRRGVASTLGWGPGFLHSTGQLHKGGPDTGIFLQITADDEEDIDIPGAGYSFGELARAQSSGDLAALQERGRRVVRIHLTDAVSGSDAVLQAATQALG